ncbi:UNVERIFIED_CONTAM: hypothetical protein Slati_3894100 [Sesamum latifolium]|uniref:Gag-pol polyprotein n=1 Tax=Sesamum latifolium TaxID=2727402 RepID=A0AAW2TNA0_9LAMI
MERSCQGTSTSGPRSVGENHNELVPTEGEVEVVEVVGIFLRYQQGKVISLNNKQGCMQSRKNKLLRRPREFDVILGMDWLSSNNAFVDCQTKEVAVEVNGQMEMVIVVIQMKVVVTAFNLIKGGCEAYLASVRDVTKISPGVSEVPVVGEFPDVFPEKLPG